MVDDPQVSPDGSQVAWIKSWMDAASNRYRAHIYLTDLASGSSRQLTDGPGQDTRPRWSPDGRSVAFLATVTPPAGDPEVGEATSFRGRLPQLFAVSSAGGEPRQLTHLAGGASEPRWSPDGRQIAFTTLIDPEEGLESLDPPATEDLDPFERFNRDVLVVDRIRWKSDSLGLLGSHYRHVARVPFDPDADTPAQPVLLTSGRSEYSSPAWSPDGTTLAIAGNLDPDFEFKRKQFIYLLDAGADGPTTPRELFGLEEMRSSDLAWSPDGATLAVCGHDSPVLGHYGLQKLWLVSVADGSGECVSEHLELSLGDYSRNQDLRRYGGDDGPRWLPDGSGLLLLVNEGGEVHLAEFDLASRTLTRLTEGDRVVYAFSTDTSRRTRVLLITSSTHPCDLFVHETAAGGRLRQLTEVNAELLAELELCDPIRFKSHSSGVEVDGWVMPPVGYRAGQRYPVILYTGGGPGGMRASVFWHEAQFYAANGYAVINCNARGNYGYGQEFSAATRGKWGDLDYEDNIAYLNDALAAFEFLDPERLAVAGGSYGGYMATWIIARHPNFKAAVVDRSLINRNAFYGTGDIGFLLDRVEFDGKLPWEIPEIYLERSPIHYVGSIETPTLVVHSALDHRCPVGNGEQLYIALRQRGIPTELVRFPNETHELSRNGRPWHRVYRIERWLDWFERWL
jgi:dipeptidyl aminopeptidase/acylaminoacyl peptidase